MAQPVPASPATIKLPEKAIEKVVSVAAAPAEAIIFRRAEFGGQMDVEGEAVRAAPPKADRALDNAAALVGRVVLVERGGATFVDKARRVEVAGAVAMVVINDSDQLYICTGAAPDVRLPVVCVGRAAGSAVRDGTRLRLLGAQDGLGSMLVARRADSDEGPRPLFTAPAAP